MLSTPSLKIFLDRVVDQENPVASLTCGVSHLAVSLVDRGQVIMAHIQQLSARRGDHNVMSPRNVAASVDTDLNLNVALVHDPGLPYRLLADT